MAPEATNYLHHAKFALMDSEVLILSMITVLILGVIFYQGHIKLTDSTGKKQRLSIDDAIFGALGGAIFITFRIMVKFLLFIMVLAVIVLANKLDITTITDETGLQYLIWLGIGILEVTPLSYLNSWHNK